MSKKELFGLMSRMFGVELPKLKRVKIEYETDVLSSPEEIQQVIEEQCKLSEHPAFNVKVTEVK